MRIVWLIVTLLVVMMIAPFPGALPPALWGVIWWLLVLCLLAALVSRAVTRRPTRAVTPAAGKYELQRRADFTQALARLESAVTTRAHQQALASIAALDAILTRHKAAGHLSPQLERELWAFTQRNAEALAGFSDDIGQALVRLLRLYTPQRKPRRW